MFIQGAMFIVFAKCSRGYVVQGATFIPDSRVLSSLNVLSGLFEKVSIK
jgi:hypothetical protein